MLNYNVTATFVRRLMQQCFLILTSNVPVPYSLVQCILSAVSSVQIAEPNKLIAKLFINYIVKMRAAKKRKVDSEGKVFKKEWTTNYFFTAVGSNAVCLICQKNVAVLKEYNIRRHFDTNHANYHSSNELTQQREVTSQRFVAYFRIQQNTL